jgi:protoheme IX farnesyltransferase
MVTLLPYLTGMSHLIYLFTAIPLGFIFLYFAILMMKRKDDKTAMKTFGFSIVYLMLMFATLLVDHYIPLSF